MKLSEAIMRGAAKKPKVRDHWFDGVGTCVWGAALDGIDRLPTQVTRGRGEGIELQAACRQEWPWAFRQCAEHPVLGDQGVRRTVADIMFSLNDGFVSWTRERIADWVRSLEVQKEIVQEHEIQKNELGQAPVLT